MPHTLLLADDNSTIQKFVELTFAEQDITVVSVGDGDRAVERLTSDPPDILLAAVNLPKRDGYNVAEFVRRDPARRHIPVILLAGAFDAVNVELVRDCGAAGVLIKPFEPALVINRVKELLGMGKPAEPPPITERLPVTPPPPRSDPPAAAVPDTAAGARPRQFPHVSPPLDATFGAPAAQPSGAAAPTVDASPALAVRIDSAVDAAPPPDTAPATREEPTMSAPGTMRVDDDQTTDPQWASETVPLTTEFKGSPNAAAVDSGVADAFAALLAVETGEAPAKSAVAETPAAATGTVELSDAVIDRIAARVVERLMQGALGHTVTRVASEVSERLVRDEIARIRQK